jgi:hypothetical protein
MVGRSCGLSQPSASRAVAMVTETLCRRAHEYIRFPTNQNELTAIKQSFHGIAGFPNVIGAIDGTHIAIKSPKVGDQRTGGTRGRHEIHRRRCQMAGRFTRFVHMEEQQPAYPVRKWLQPRWMASRWVEFTSETFIKFLSVKLMSKTRTPK